VVLLPAQRRPAERVDQHAEDLSLVRLRRSVADHVGVYRPGEADDVTRTRLLHADQLRPFGRDDRGATDQRKRHRHGQRLAVRQQLGELPRPLVGRGDDVVTHDIVQAARDEVAAAPPPSVPELPQRLRLDTGAQ
jgi:hypothetical protein